MSVTSYPTVERRAGASAASRAAILLYGVAAYLFFFCVFTYMIGFVGGFLVPRHIANGLPAQPWKAILLDVVLLATFAIQHSVMARPAFKRWWTQIIPPAAERSTFVLLASALLALVIWQWRPLPGVVWKVESPIGVAMLHGLYFLGGGSSSTRPFSSTTSSCSACASRSAMPSAGRRSRPSSPSALSIASCDTR